MKPRLVSNGLEKCFLILVLHSRFCRLGIKNSVAAPFHAIEDSFKIDREIVRPYSRVLSKI